LSQIAQPSLNVEDFTCVVNQYAIAPSLLHEEQIGHYTNGDASSIAPVLNVEDFTRLLKACATGCP
jgi:hypothetical protein